MKRLLIATDLSARSDRALQRAVALAKRCGATLEVMHVVDDALPAAIIEQQEAAARALIEKLLGAIPSGADVKTTIQISKGIAHNAILQRAEEIEADLIVLGITRYSAYELFQGTTAERIVRLGRYPVLLAKEPVLEDYRRVLVATDNSPGARRAMASAVEAAPGAEFFLLHAIHVPFKGLLGAEAQSSIRTEQVEHFRRLLDDEFRAVAERPGGELPLKTILIEEGEIHDVIRAQVARLRPGLLALGTHGRAGLRHFMIGSVAADLLSDPPVDVLVAKD